MNAPLAYLDGRWLPYAELSIPIHDAGFVLGTTVTEQLRTLGGELFRLEDHLRRLEASLAIIGIALDLSLEELAEISRKLAQDNLTLQAAGNDLGLGIFVTPGDYATLVPNSSGQPRVCVYTYPLPFGQWAAKYEAGQTLAISRFRQVPIDCWPAELKCRSRMHYHLADKEAGTLFPGARAVLLDHDGYLSEASTASVILYREGEGIVTPKSDKILPGISLMTLLELAAGLGIECAERDITVEELRAADEVWLASTSICILPAVQLDGARIGNGQPGPVFRELLAAWNKRVGFDIAAQSRKFA